MSITLQQIFQRHFESFLTRHRVSEDMYRAGWYVARCRTEQLGGHVDSCPDGHHHQIVFNSCRHRCCPQCQWLAREKWLEGWQSRLLPCPHHHLVFTLPSELNQLWRYNKEQYANTLFAAASQTLAELLGDPKYVGGRVGVLCALHTWKQTLEPHIHLHCLVTAGGLSGEEQWLKPKKSCLLPRKVLMLKFRGKFKAMLREKVCRGEIQLPPQMTPQSLEQLLGKLTRKAWNVKIHDAYEHGQGVARYLARYLRGGPIKDSRLVGEREGQLSFRYRLGTDAGGDGKRQGEMSLPVDAFIGRWLEHVPPRGFQAVRGYGLYSGNQHSRLDQARETLGVMPEALEEGPDSGWQTWCESAGMAGVGRCPVCGQPLVSHHEFRSGRAPPLWKLERQPLSQSA